MIGRGQQQRARSGSAACWRWSGAADRVWPPPACSWHVLSEDGPGGAPSASTMLVRSAAAQTAVEAVVSMLFMTWRDGVLSTSSRHAVERGFAFTCVGSELHGRPVRPGGPKSVENFGKRTTFNHLHTKSVGARSRAFGPPRGAFEASGRGELHCVWEEFTTG